MIWLAQDHVVVCAVVRKTALLPPYHRAFLLPVIHSSLRMERSSSLRA